MADETPQQTTVIAAICTAMGMAIQAIAAYFLKRSSNAKRSDLKFRDQIFQEYRTIVEGLNTKLKNVEAAVEVARQAHLNACVENESLKTEIKLLRVQLAETQASLAEAREQINHTSTRLDGLEGKS